jgi:hypothetical protein
MYATIAVKLLNNHFLLCVITNNHLKYLSNQTLSKTYKMLRFTVLPHICLHHTMSLIVFVCGVWAPPA